MAIFYLTLLFTPIAWFAYKYYVDFYAYGETKAVIGQIIPLFCFMLYAVFVISFGVEESLELFKNNVGRGRGIFTFLLPGLGLAMAAFPYQASELSQNYIHLTNFDLNSLFRILGWLLICLVILRHIAVMA